MAESTGPLSGGKLIAVALMFAGVAALINLLYISWVKKQNETQSVDVAVLKNAVRPGQRLSPRDYDIVKVPEQFADAIFGEFGLRAIEPDKIEQRIADKASYARPAPVNTILSYYLFETPGGSRTDTMVEEGMVLVALPLHNEIQPGNLQPGMVVDISAGFQVGGAIPVIMPIMERVKVVALDRHVVDADAAFESESSSRSRTRQIRSFDAISIIVRPDVARNLTMVQSLAVQGRFYLYVRKPGDNTRPEIDRGEINDAVLEMLRKATGK